MVAFVLTGAIAALGSLIVLALARAARRASAAEHARRLGVVARWRVPARPRRWIERALADAAVEVEPEVACELWVVGVGAIGVVTFALAPDLLLLAIPAAVVGGPIALRMVRHRARTRFVSALPGALEQMAAAMRGGVGVQEAIAALADDDGPVAPDLRRVCARASLGGGLAGALQVWPQERPLASVRAAAGGLAVAASAGGAAAGAIDGLAASLRERLGAVAEARALSAQARLSAIVVGGAPIAYLAFSAAVDPASMTTLVATPTGQVCLIAGLALEALGILWIRRIVKSGEPE
jgi:tight adherence protein B